MNFAEYIASKLTTTAKNTTGAINELNTKIKALEAAGGCPIPVGYGLFGFISQNPSAVWPGTTWSSALVDRLPVGVGNLYALGTQGGSRDAAIVSHDHTIAHTHGIAARNTGSDSTDHTHSVPAANTNGRSHQHDHAVTNWYYPNGNSGFAGGAGGPSGRANVEGESQEHTHYISARNTGGRSAIHVHSVPTATTNSQSTTTSGTSGVAGTNANMPPYEAVYFWRRLT